MSFLNRKVNLKSIKRSRPLLGTYVEIELQAAIEENLLNRWITTGFEAISMVDRLMSYHKPDSDLTLLNRARPDVWVDVHPATCDVLQASNDMFATSGGVFDIRCGSALAERGVLPSFSSLGFHGYKSKKHVQPLEIHGTRARKTGPWILDLGGIAKGFAVDLAVKTIEELASRAKLSGSVNAGGDLRVWGDRNAPVIVRTGGDKSGQACFFSLRRTALATSSVRRRPGSSERLSAAAHVRMPGQNLLKESKTVSVFAESCQVADALTKVVLLGRDIAARCLAAYQARALVFGPDGRLSEAIG